MSDKKISCRQCGEEFTFTAGEQEWFQAKGLQEPKYCKACREIRKNRREEEQKNPRRDDNQKAA